MFRELLFWLLNIRVLPMGICLLTVILLGVPFFQRNVLCANKSPYRTKRTSDCPESFGFLRNQVIPYTVPASDGGSLHVWLVIPTKIYLKHESALMASWTLDELQEIARGILANDENVVVLYFHDSSGRVAQDRRAEAYRSISAGDPDHIYLVSFDYRGFGRSTGTTSPSALVTDAVTMINWIHKKADIPFSRIALVGQSLGTAVAAAAAGRILHENPYVEFAGLILCVPFVDAVSCLCNSPVWGKTSLLWSIRRVGFLRRWSESTVTDSWRTLEHIKAIVQKSDALRLTLMDTVSTDPASRKMNSSIMTMARKHLKKKGAVEEASFELEDAGSIKEFRFSNRVLRHVTLRHGDYASIMNGMPVAYEVAKVIQNSGKG